MSKQEAFPARSMRGKVVIEVGCEYGQDLARPMFDNAAVRYGIDIDAKKIVSGQKMYPHSIYQNLVLMIGCAESLELPTACGDEYLSRVSLPYSNIPVALKEARRVLKDGGQIYLTMHDLRLQMEWLIKAICEGKLKRVLDHAYIFAASIWFALTGDCVGRPGYRGCETFQTRARMTKELSRAGFGSIRHSRVGRNWVIEAQAITT